MLTHYRLTGKEKRVGGFDLIWDDGQVLADETGLDGHNTNSQTPTNSFLGKQLGNKLNLMRYFVTNGVAMI